MSEVAVETGSQGLESSTQSEQSESQNAPGLKPVAVKAGESNQEAQKRYLEEQNLDAIVKVKIDGEMHEMPVREVLKLNSLEKVSQKRMDQAAKIQKQAKMFYEYAKSNPKAFLKETGIDPIEFAEATLAEQYDLMQMTPEQKELMELKKWKEIKESEEKRQKEEWEKQELTKAEQAEMVSLEKEITEAWAESGLPKHKYFGSVMAAKMLSAIRQNKPLQAKEAAAKVKGEFLEHVQEIFGQLDPEQIRQVLGDGTLKKLKEWDIKRVTDKSASKLPNGKGPAKQAASQKKSKPMSEVEWKAYMEEMRSQIRD